LGHAISGRLYGFARAGSIGGFTWARSIFYDCGAMKKILSVLVIVAGAVTMRAVTEQPAKPKIELAQVPKWSADDLEFFLHGSMSTEVVPERVLRAFIKIYPDLFPASDLAYLGLIPDPQFGWPIGFSRKAEVKHLGGLSAVGINCASCHMAQITSSEAKGPIRILGATSHFNVEGFFGAVLVSTFKTSEPASMKLFLNAYFANPALDAAWDAQQAQITERMAADPFGAKDIAPGELHQIAPGELELAKEAVGLPELAHSMLKLFHNMRAALHVPDQPPDKVPPASGPGRNDAFGLLSASLLNRPQPYAPIKFGLVWNIDQRTWVHWDGNTKSPIARNLLASLGLGAPLHGKRGDLDFATVKRQTDLSESIRTPKYPFAIDQAAAKRGAAHFESKCASCHGGPENDKRLYSIAEVGTDPHRAELFTEKQAEGFNKFLAELEAAGYEPPKEFGVRSTGKYWAATLGGVWARSPYLHNGSVRTMQDLLTAPAQRAKTFHRGSQDYDANQMGYTDGGLYVFDTAGEGNSNAGHDYGTKLSAVQKRELMEYLKTL
jgi:hypothetical protein